MSRLFLFSLLLLCLSLIDDTFASNPCATSNQNAWANYVFRIYQDTYSLNFTSLTAWGGGGGSQQTIPSSSGGPFSGRKYGGGVRSSIYGTRAYGSGYPYGATNTSTIAGRPFPYGAWPISFGSYMGGQEVIGSAVDIMRPGGPLVTVQVGTTDTKKWPHLQNNEVYTMIGDRDSIIFMMGDLVNWCHATPQWPTMFNVSNSTIKPENVIQYYRASSFALAYSGYNNSYARNNPTSGQSFAQSDRLPSNIASSAFLTCVNSTIGTAVPIADAASSPPSYKPLSKGAIAGIVIGSVAGGILWLLPYLLRWRQERQQKKLLLQQQQQ